MRGLSPSVLALLKDATRCATDAEGVCPSCGAALTQEPAELECWIHRMEDLIARQDRAYTRRHP